MAKRNTRSTQGGTSQNLAVVGYEIVSVEPAIFWHKSIEGIKGQNSSETWSLDRVISDLQIEGQRVVEPETVTIRLKFEVEVSPKFIFIATKDVMHVEVRLLNPDFLIEKSVY